MTTFYNIFTQDPQTFNITVALQVGLCIYYYDYIYLETITIYYPAGICPTICMSYLESREKAYVIPVAIITCRGHKRMEDYFSQFRQQ